MGHKEIVDLAAELRILIEIGKVGLGEVDLDCIRIFLFLLMLLLVSFGSLTVINRFIDIPLLLLSLIKLLHHLGSDSHRQLLEHLLHLLHLFLQRLTLLSQSTDQLICFTLIDHGFVLDFLGLISVTKSPEGLFVVISGRGDGADHQSLRVASQSVL